MSPDPTATEGPIVATGTERDADDLAHRVDTDHPAARELARLTAAEPNTRFRLWLDEDAELLLVLERGGSDDQDAVRLQRLPVTATAVPRVLHTVTAPVLRRLEAPAEHYRSRSEADRDIGAMVNIFRVQLARLTAVHRDRAEVTRAIHAQIGRAADERQRTRRTAFLGWYIARAYGTDDSAKQAVHEDLSQVLSRDDGMLVTQMAWAWERYRSTIRWKIQPPMLSKDELPDRKRLGRGALHWYYDLRILDGRRLTEQERLELRAELPYARVTPDRVVLDQWSREADHPIFNRDSQFIQRYRFDAALSFFQEGTRQLWLRVPAALAAPISPYTDRHGLAVETSAVGDDLWVHLNRVEADGENSYQRYDPRPWLDDLLPLRDAIAAGDLRAVYIAWRALYLRGDAPQVGPPPPVPPGMDEDELTEPLHALVRLLEEAP